MLSTTLLRTATRTPPTSPATTALEQRTATRVNRSEFDLTDANKYLAAPEPHPLDADVRVDFLVVLCHDPRAGLRFVAGSGFGR
jgi:hypothetical protein